MILGIYSNVYAIFLKNYIIQNAAFSAWSLYLFAGLLIYTSYARLCDVINTLFAIEI